MAVINEGGIKKPSSTTKKAQAPRRTTAVKPKATNMPSYKRSTTPTSRAVREENDLDSLTTMPRFSVTAPAQTVTPAQLVNAPVIDVPDNIVRQMDALEKVQEAYRLPYADTVRTQQQAANVYGYAAQLAADQQRRRRMAGLSIPVRLATGRESGILPAGLRSLPSYNGVYGQSALQYVPLMKSTDAAKLSMTPLY